MAAGTSGGGALSGIRVLDLTSVFLGPYCTQTLGDMGAEILKIESPIGDSTRSLGPGRHPGMSGSFHSVNRNKTSCVIDLKSPHARPVIERLAQQADVLVYNIRPAAMARLGLSYEWASTANPRLIYCGAYGYGESGPYAGRPAFDDSIQAISGIAGYQGLLAGEPMYCGTVVADKVTGLVAANAVLAALYERQQSGRGQRIDVPMFETMAAFALAEHLHGAAFDPPLSPPIYPRVVSRNRRPYRTLDGYIAVVPYNDGQWQRFFRLVGRESLLSDSRFTTMSARTANIDALYEILSSEVSRWHSAELLSRLETEDIPGVPVTMPDELLDDPHLQAVEFSRVVDHPVEGRLRSVMPTTLFSRTPSSIRVVAPRLGEHTIQALAQAGFSDGDISELRRLGAVYAEEDLAR